MPDINVSVKNKIAVKADEVEYVCGNSDFRIIFDFDAEWDAYEAKTARFLVDGKYIDTVFTGSECAVPIISDTHCFRVGVYAGDLHTTTPARVPCRKSILCGGGLPAEPSDDVYAQIMALLNETMESVEADADRAEKGANDAFNAAVSAAGSVSKAVEAVTDATAAKTAAEAAKNAAEAANESAQAVASNPAYIGDNGNWYTWDAATKQYKDSGKPSRGADGDDYTLTDADKDEIAELVMGQLPIYNGGVS